uniref:Uncharacterized protein n=1 Tax=Cucumis melo TaxID=3656 RepID=A0A9I9E3N2_CUCME
AARLATGGRRGSATQKRTARLHTRTRLTRRFGFGFGRADVERLRVQVRRLEARSALAAGLQSARRRDGWLTDVLAASDLSGSFRLDRSGATRLGYPP